MGKMTEFEKYAVRGRGISSLSLHRFNSLYASYMNPMIIEERQLNVAQMDVFSRLMMDRIIFLGCPINDDVANIIQAQLLFLESNDPKADIMLYINSPGGMVYSGLGIYDTMQTIQPDVATICTGMAASMASILLAAGARGKRSVLPHSRVMIHQPMKWRSPSGRSSNSRRSSTRSCASTPASRWNRSSRMRTAISG